MDAASVSAYEPREIVSMRLAGFVERAGALLRSSPTPEVLGDLTRALTDEDTSIHVAQTGLHVVLLDLCEHADAAIQTAALEATSAAIASLPPGWGFPQRRSRADLLPDAPLTFSCATWYNAPETHAKILGLSERSTKADESALPVPDALVRVVPRWIHAMESQDHVGQQLWPAGVALSRWLAAHHRALKGDVIELGSGPGLAGVVAGLCAAYCNGHRGGDSGVTRPVVLSDFDPFVLRNLAYNAAINDPSINTDLARACGGCVPVDGLFRVVRLDWTACTSSSQDGSIDDVPLGRFDFIFASDVICCRDDAEALVRSIAALLRKPGAAQLQPGSSSDASGGIAVLCLPPESARYGIDALVALLASVHLCIVERGPVPPLFSGGPATTAYSESTPHGVAALEMVSAESSSSSVAGGYESLLELWFVRHQLESAMSVTASAAP